MESGSRPSSPWGSGRPQWSSVLVMCIQSTGLFKAGVNVTVCVSCFLTATLLMTKGQKQPWMSTYMCMTGYKQRISCLWMDYFAIFNHSHTHKHTQIIFQLPFKYSILALLLLPSEHSTIHTSVILSDSRQPCTKHKIWLNSNPCWSTHVCKCLCTYICICEHKSLLLWL